MSIQKGSIFSVLLYPDTETYDYKLCLNKVLNTCSICGCDYAFATHTLELKPHTHIFIRFPNERSLKGVQRLLSPIPDNFVQVKNRDNTDNAQNVFACCVRYLVHADSVDKVKYSTDIIKSNFDITPYFKDVSCNSSKSSEDVGIKVIFDYLKQFPDSSYCDILNFVLDNNLYSVYRRSYNLLKDIIPELRSKRYDSEVKKLSKNKSFINSELSFEKISN